MGQRKKEDLNIPTMMLCIIGAVLTVFGLLVLKNDNFKLNVLSTEGTVTSVQTKTNAEGIVESRAVNLSYKVGRSDYNATISNFSEEIDIGSKMTLYYDILSPESVSDKRKGYVGYLSAFLGVVLVVKKGPRFLRIIKDNYL